MIQLTKKQMVADVVSKYETKICPICKRSLIVQETDDWIEWYCDEQDDTMDEYDLMLYYSHNEVTQAINISKYRLYISSLDDNMSVCDAINITDLFIMPRIFINKNTDFKKLKSKIDVLRSFI